MKINYDKIADAIYINLKEGKIDRTIEVNETMIVDVDKEGGIIGMEILDASSKEGLQNFENNVKHGVPVEIISRTPLTA